MWVPNPNIFLPSKPIPFLLTCIADTHPPKSEPFSFLFIFFLHSLLPSLLVRISRPSNTHKHFLQLHCLLLPQFLSSFFSHLLPSFFFIFGAGDEQRRMTASSVMCDGGGSVVPHSSLSATLFSGDFRRESGEMWRLWTLVSLFLQCLFFLH